MKHLKRFLALTLVFASIFAIAVPAMAASSTITPGSSKYKSYWNLTSSPSYTISLGSGTSTGMKCTVYLALNDGLGSSNWKLSNTMTLTKDSTHYTGTIRPSSTFSWVDGRSDAARLQFKAASTNSSNIVVIYPN